jgi:outer membrane receptor protein involved in Fe transport
MLLPTTAALFNWGRNAQAFVRYARSYRPPIAAATLRGVNRLAGDRYGAWEFGVRLSPTARRPIDGSLSLSAGKWRDVQAETVDNVGNLSAANIGNARVLTIEGTLGWQFSPRLRASGGVTINDTSVARDGPSLIIVTHARLPNIPDVGARLSLSYASPQEHRLSFRLSSTVNYVGYSRPGIGAVLDRVQGGFVEVAAEGSISLADTSLFLRGTNLLDTRGDRFALGTIAQAALETQYVPQRPRTLTLGVRWTSPGSRGR